MDAITLSIAEQARDASLARDVGAIGITIAVVSNSVVKSAIALYEGGRGFGKLVGLCLGAATAAGLTVVMRSHWASRSFCAVMILASSSASLSGSILRTRRISSL